MTGMAALVPPPTRRNPADYGARQLYSRPEPALINAARPQSGMACPAGAAASCVPRSNSFWALGDRAVGRRLLQGAQLRNGGGVDRGHRDVVSRGVRGCEDRQGEHLPVARRADPVCWTQHAGVRLSGGDRPRGRRSGGPPPGRARIVHRERAGPGFVPARSSDDRDAGQRRVEDDGKPELAARNDRRAAVHRHGRRAWRDVADHLKGVDRHSRAVGGRDDDDPDARSCRRGGAAAARGRRADQTDTQRGGGTVRHGSGPDQRPCSEHNRGAVVDEHPVLAVPPHRPGEHGALDVAA